MAGVVFCDPHCLYNILQQQRRVPRLAEPGYLCLLDARTQDEYDESHIVTARRIEQSPAGEYLVPDSEELGYIRYCVVYDCQSSSLDCWDYEEEEKEKDAEEGTAVQHAQNLEKFTRHPVLVLSGGYRLFSAYYNFLRTQKILWMPQELDNFQLYPVEIIPLKLYMGNSKQACDQQIQKDLKIKAQVNISEHPTTLITEEGKYLHVPVPDSLETDLFSSFPTICHFIESLELCSEMQNEHEASSGLCETALRVGDQNPWHHHHRHLRTTLLTGSKETSQQGKAPPAPYHHDGEKSLASV
ncbi:serine/threonine/tyrosine-interacting-like protein 1 isoform X2 [Heliangelus exortis]|uniref:serine/threonine/tyrosine-interacting-like protein 1 isoform X2 n=1 Tax=Heliangelus exortis TaxID=472823 RepID=UPI003A936E7A